MTIPLGAIIISACYLDEENTSLQAVWYYRDLYVATTQEEKKMIGSDIVSGRAVLLSLSGSAFQILNIIWQSDGFMYGGNLNEEKARLLASGLEANAGKTISFDNVISPQGTGLAIDLICDITDSMETLQDKINNHRDTVKLTLSTEWSPISDL